jgi:hypothetical protein
MFVVLRTRRGGVDLVGNCRDMGGVVEKRGKWNEWMSGVERCERRRRALMVRRQWKGVHENDVRGSDKEGCVAQGKVQENLLWQG